MKCRSLLTICPAEEDITSPPPDTEPGQPTHTPFTDETPGSTSDREPDLPTHTPLMDETTGSTMACRDARADG